jgi:hypothetical protein
MKQKFYYTKYTQNSDSAENLNLRLYSENKRENVRAGRLAWLGHWLYEPKVAGSSPVRPTTPIFSPEDEWLKKHLLCEPPTPYID